MIRVSPMKKLEEALSLVGFLTKRFRSEIGGVAAIEFAFIAPLMLLMYIGTIEVSSAVSANRKLSRASSTIGDLLTQLDPTDFAGNCIPRSILADIVEIADDIMFPYTQPRAIVITEVEVKGSATTVVWSEAYQQGMKDTAGDPYTLPVQLTADDGFLIAAKTAISYTPLYSFIRMNEGRNISLDSTAIPMEEVLYLRPRTSNSLDLCAP